VHRILHEGSSDATLCIEIYFSSSDSVHAVCTGKYILLLAIVHVAYSRNSSVIIVSSMLYCCVFEERYLQSLAACVNTAAFWVTETRQYQCTHTQVPLVIVRALVTSHCPDSDCADHMQQTTRYYYTSNWLFASAALGTVCA
jgi:hypothetical protein